MSGTSMKKAVKKGSRMAGKAGPKGRAGARQQETPMRAEYDFSGGVRGKYAKRFAAGSNVVVLEPDVVGTAAREARGGFEAPHRLKQRRSISIPTVTHGERVAQDGMRPTSATTIVRAPSTATASSSGSGSRILAAFGPSVRQGSLALTKGSQALPVCSPA